MAIFKQTDDLSKVRIGGIIELSDGSKHVAICSTTDRYVCDCSNCSLEESCYGLDSLFEEIECATENKFYFKLYIDEPKGDN